MTEERFYYEERIDSIIDKLEDKGYSSKSLKALTVLLNDFVNENKELNKLYDISEQLNKALSELNEELHQLQMELVDENRRLKKELSETIDLLSKEINSSENAFNGLKNENNLFKDKIIKRIDEYIWAWEDEGAPVADEMKKLKDDILRGFLE